MAELIVDAADFDGTNDYLTRGAGLTGASDSKRGVLSCWLRFDGGDGAIQRLIASADSVGSGSVAGVSIRRHTSNEILFSMDNSAGGGVLSARTDTGGSGAGGGTGGTGGTIVAGSAWYHILAAWDLAASVVQIYVDDASTIFVTTATNDTIDYTKADWSIGALPNGAGKLNGAIAEFYFAPGQYLDFSVEANRRKFISANGFPVDLGSDGSTPTGTAPLVYLHLDNAEAVANFATNRGSGGNFSITGTLETADSSPSDGLLIVEAPSVGSAEAFGTPALALTLTPAAIASAEAFGSLNAALDRALLLTAIASAEAFGGVSITLYITPTGIESVEIVGDPLGVFFVIPREIAFVSALRQDMDFER